jgi:phosphopantetheinyl transferase
MQYYIGLSILSTIYDTGAAQGRMERQRLRTEARRTLSLLEGRLLEKNDIAREAQGRPFFPGREVDFNIAHSGVLTAVSYVKGKNLRTGCDVERVRPRTGAREIAEEFFSAPEKNYVFPQGNFDEAKFYEIWTLKECFLKLQGLSVFDMAACPSFISGVENAFAFGAAVSLPLSFCLYELSGGADEPAPVRYMLATALEGKQQQPPEIRWFSHLSLACKKTAEIKAAPNPAETVSPKM